MNNKIIMIACIINHVDSNLKFIMELFDLKGISRNFVKGGRHFVTMYNFYKYLKQKKIILRNTLNNINYY